MARTKQLFRRGMEPGAPKKKNRSTSTKRVLAKMTCSKPVLHIKKVKKIRFTPIARMTASKPIRTAQSLGSSPKPFIDLTGKEVLHCIKVEGRVFIDLTGAD